LEDGAWQLVAAALTHGLPAAGPAQAADSLRRAFHDETLPAGCPPDLGALAQQAHRMAAGAGSGGHLEGALQSLWPRVELDRPVTLTAQAYAAGAAPSMRRDQDVAHRKCLLPSSEASPPNDGFWQDFRADLEATARTGAAHDGDRSAHLLAALRRWAWCVPAHEPDEPLLEHLQVTAAIAAALWQLQTRGAPDRERPLLLAHLDLTGLQGYLFATANTGAGGVARRLRARSLTLSLVVEALAYTLLEPVDLPIVNLLAANGGHCYLLLPHSPQVLDVLSDTWRRLQRELHEQYGGAISATLVWRALAAGDLASVGEALNDLAHRRSLAKQQPLRDVLQEGGNWREDAWLDAERFEGRSACEACHTRPAVAAMRDGEDEVCAACASDYRLGADLPRARYLAWVRDAGTATGGDSGVAVISGYHVQALRRLDDCKGSPFLVQEANAFATRAAAVPVLGRYLANHVPVDEDGAPRDFAWIARQAGGAPLLAVVKADVDHLGALFAWGLRREDGGAADRLTRVLALSRLVDTFFAGWVEGLVEDECDKCYVVYSGGDDLLIVGPWDKAVQAVLKIRDDFARYTGHPQVTLSAGVAIVRPNTPIADAVRAADEQEALAKNGGRNRLAVFGQVLGWERAASVMERWRAHTAGSAIPSSVLHR